MRKADNFSCDWHNQGKKMTDMQTKGKTKTNKAMVGPKQLTQTIVLSCLGEWNQSY